MRILPILLVLSIFGLTGCSTTTAEVRADPGEQGSFIVDQPYRVVLRNFEVSMDSCFNYTFGHASWFYSIKENETDTAARADLIIQGMARRVMVSTDIVSKDGKTDITYYSNPNFSIFSSVRPLVEKWARGEKCE